ncbi:hypothetical protein [Paenibacillus alba]|uniref:Histidine kinase N-terminal 7TM region domain-containing protein n=1 Tax=Paenibacillus alba TaxID=1197127 RepID=A0ABU6G4I9_9BACL|nr:hypothetical protein [Paenibacillus alba]MEC0229088.1 hypothetical protein [Paenibacillus alba]
MWWGVTAVFVVSICIFILEFRPLWRKRIRKEIWIFSILLFLGAGLNIAHILRIEIPNPLQVMVAIYKPISDAMVSFLK